MTGPLDDTGLRDAVQAALAAEHAAVWCYGLASAYLPGSTADAVATAARAHRDRRDATVGVLAAARLTPVPAAAAYRTPTPVSDPSSAAALLVTAESDVAAAWRAVCERTDPGSDAGLRPLGVDAVVTAARNAVPWRRLSRTTPTVEAFPGQV